MDFIKLDENGNYVGLPAPIIASLVVCLIIAVISIIVCIQAKKQDPLKKSSGLLLLAEMAVEYCDNFVKENMGQAFVNKLGPYAGFCFAYVFLGFTIGLFGFATPMTYYIVPLGLAIGSFLLIHITAIRYQKWGYFERFVSPFPVFLPINLISMWAPLISLSFRMFGNACSGMVLMTLVYGVFQMLSEMIFGGLTLPIAAVVAPFLHAYFDLFSAFVQTAIFAILSMLFAASEVPNKIDLNYFENEF